MKTSYNSTAVLGTAIASGFLAVIPSSLAHHLMDGSVPSTSMQGLLSGLGHPVIGLDHLAFVLAIGLIAALRGSMGALVPTTFVLATLVGTGLHLASWSLPFAEAAIAISVVAAGAILFTRADRVSPSSLVGFSALAGVFHGYAYGEAIVGAESTPLIAYLLGFSLIQLAIGIGVYLVGTWMTNRHPEGFGQLARLGGTAVGVLGLGFLTGA